jgi:hypothetical protein
VMHNNHCTHAFKFLFRLSFLGSAPVWIHVHKKQQLNFSVVHLQQVSSF